VSWQLAVFAGLALVLAGGFAWYERSRPSARLVALVAALAALAVAGRLVLAPVPNLVATTDIAMLTGYALGGGPGFAVGALAAPISNIWLGQGPWTAWQMAGWGLVGLGGAWLATATRRRLGRLGLACACAVCGFAYGALLDLSVMVTYGGEQSLDRYLALSARGLPFNVVHAAGNFAIALAAGPALVRMISRFRTRLEFTWRPAGALPAVALAALAAAALAAGPRPAAAAPSGADWLAGVQAADGGFAATPGQPSSPAMTGWAMLGLEAAGRNPLDVRSAGRNAVTYLRSEATRLRSVGDLERTVLALSGAGLDPRRFAGTDLVAELRSRRDRDGSVDGQVNLTAFYALALRAAGAGPGALRRSGGWLRRAQNADGGWGIQPGAPSEADSSGAALQALVAAGASGRSTARGARWLRAAQRAGGGWALSSSGLVNSQSTAWAIQGLVATGSGGDAVARGIGYLGRQRAPDGHYRYSAASDQTPIWVTAQVLLALERQPFPVPAVARTQRASRPDREDGDGSAPQGAGTDAGGGATAAGSSSTSAGGGAAVGGDAGASGGGTTGGAGGAGPPVGGGEAGEVATDQIEVGQPPTGPDAEPPAPAVSVSYADAEEDGGDDAYLLAGLGLLAAVVAGGLLWRRYRAQ
jgi:uncharacterized membrane protein